MAFSNPTISGDRIECGLFKSKNFSVFKSQDFYGMMENLELLYKSHISLTSFFGSLPFQGGTLLLFYLSLFSPHISRDSLSKKIILTFVGLQQFKIKTSFKAGP